MNPELKELIALLEYRNSVGEPLQHVVMTRDLFIMIVKKAINNHGMWLDDDSVFVINRQTYNPNA